MALRGRFLGKWELMGGDRGVGWSGVVERRKDGCIEVGRDWARCEGKAGVGVNGFKARDIEDGKKMEI